MPTYNKGAPPKHHAAIKQQTEDAIKQQSFDVASLNIRGAKYKLNEIKNLMYHNSNFAPSILALQETWLTKNEHLIVPNTTSYWKGLPFTLHKGRNHGGIAIIINSRLNNNQELHQPSQDNDNILWVKIHTHEVPLYIATLYSRPGHLLEHTEILSILEHNISVPARPAAAGFSLREFGKGLREMKVNFFFFF